MSLSTRSTKVSLLAVGALVVFGLIEPGEASAPSGASACRATVLQAQALGRTLPLNELAEANGAETPCATDDGSLLDINASDTGGLLEAHVLTAKTKASAATPVNGAHAASARAGVVSFALHPGALAPELAALDVEVQGLQSEVSFACGGSSLTSPTLASDGTVVTLSIGGDKVLELPGDLGLPNTLDVGPIHVYFNEVITTQTSITRRALRVVVDAPTSAIATPLAEVIVAEAYLAFPAGQNATTCPPPPPPPGNDTGKRMTGGGRILNAGGTTREAHGFTLPCNATKAGNLNINGDFGHFKLDAVSTTCSYDPTLLPPEHAGGTFNKLRGIGTGRCDGAGSVPVDFTFTDQGEPNAGRDTVKITIGSPGQPCYLSIGTTTFDGNHQAHG